MTAETAKGLYAATDIIRRWIMCDTTAAAVWLRTITGQKVHAMIFEGFDSALLERIVSAVNAF